MQTLWTLIKALGISVLLLAYLVVPLAADDNALLQKGMDAFQARDFDEAHNLLRPLAEGGNADAQFYFALSSLRKFDSKQAAVWFIKASDQGHAGAQYELANMLSTGFWVERDDDKARSLYLMSARQGYVEAQHSLAFSYLNGDGSLFPQDYDQARFWYRKAAEQGDVSAQYMLGNIYLIGRGVKPDNAQAMIWYRKAAEQGDANAQYGLGSIYRFPFLWFAGGRIEQDVREAVVWYSKAAEQGYYLAQTGLGEIYEDGEGDVPQNIKRAVIWYSQAAEQGNAELQYKLGQMYENLDAVKDHVEAEIWYRKAAEGGYSPAQDNLDWMCQNNRGVEQI